MQCLPFPIPLQVPPPPALASVESGLEPLLSRSAGGGPGTTIAIITTITATAVAADGAATTAAVAAAVAAAVQASNAALCPPVDPASREDGSRGSPSTITAHTADAMSRVRRGSAAAGGVTRCTTAKVDTARGKASSSSSTDSATGASPAQSASGASAFRSE